MATFTQKILVTDAHRVIVELPPDYPVGVAEVTITVSNPVGAGMGTEKSEEEKIRIARKRAALFGALKGKLIMHDDFDEPLEDFAEYMS